jgi:plasmid stabilization system protein ParE
MSLRVVYTDDFPDDVAVQARWYARQKDGALALGYARAVEATLEFLAQHPKLGTLCTYLEPQLADLRY